MRSGNGNGGIGEQTTWSTTANMKTQPHDHTWLSRETKGSAAQVLRNNNDIQNCSCDCVKLFSIEVRSVAEQQWLKTPARGTIKLSHHRRCSAALSSSDHPSFSSLDRGGSDRTEHVTYSYELKQ